MAKKKKSKTQRAKASAARAARKEQAQARAAAAENEQVAEVNTAKTESFKQKIRRKSEGEAALSSKDGQTKGQTRPPAKREDKKPARPRRFAFLKDVRAEMRRVTWPTKQDVLRWTVVVIVALIFFGVFVAATDSLILPLLDAISSIATYLRM